MIPYKLIRTDSNSNDDIPLKRPGFIIGRSSPSDVQFRDVSDLSRQHLKIILNGDVIEIQDLNSKNGTYLNNEKIEKSISYPVYPGDRITMGTLEFQLTADAPDQADCDSEESFAETRIYSTEHLWKGKIDTSDLKVSSSAFQLLYMISRELIQFREPRGFIEMAVKSVRDILEADFLYLYLLDSRDQPYLAAWEGVKKPSGDGTKPEAAVSRTLLNKVIRDKVAIAASDIADHPQFRDAESIILRGIRSLMAAPLIVENTLIGVVAAEMRGYDRPFGKAHVELLSAIANLLALGLEQNRLLTEIKRENEIRQRLAQFHSPNVVDAIIRKGGGLESESREVTIWFCDIHGFTGFAESAPVEKIDGMINAFFEMGVDAVFRHEGTLDKYLGDGFLAVFGAPFDIPGHPLQAVKAALELHETLRKYNRNGNSGTPIRIRSGINTGRVIAGDIGAHIRKEYTVIGDAVNVAHRIQEELAGEDEVVVGPETARYIMKKAILTPLGEHQLRGRENRLKVFRVDSLTD